MLEQNYREILKRELGERCKTNKSYSLRAFARDLNLEHGQLSKVLNGKKNISVSAAKLIAEKIFSKSQEREFFVNLVEYSTSKNSTIKERALKQINSIENNKKYLNLELDHFNLISEWYHYAILDLSLVDGFELTSNSVSAYLGISKIEAKLAIDRLQRMGLLEEKQGRLIKSTLKISTPTNIPSMALRTHHRQMMTKALESIEVQSVEERYLRAKTMSVAESSLPVIRNLIEEFMDKVSEVIQKQNKKEKLYQLNVQLFDLKEKRKK